MSAQDTAGTAREGMTMDTSETTRLHRCAKCGDERSAVESCEGDCYPLCGPCHVELRHEDAAVWRARVDAAERERDVLRAQQAPLLDAHDALVAAARAAGWTGAGATGAELVAWVRRGEREACAARLERVARECDTSLVEAVRYGMKMTRVLLVTGARSLADDRDAEAWARGLIAAALVGVDLLIVGDAPGPDAWACRIQRDALRRVECYRTHGPNARWIDTAHCEEWDRVRLWTGAATDAHPLLRNEMMVADAAGLVDAGHTVTVLALLDVTRKSAGSDGIVFAPSWAILRPALDARTRADDARRVVLGAAGEGAVDGSGDQGGEHEGHGGRNRRAKTP